VCVACPFFGPRGALRRLRPDDDATSVALVVACGANFSGSDNPASGEPDGSVDATNFLYSLDQFVSGNLAKADVTGSDTPNDPTSLIPDGSIDATELFVFLDLFVQGCS